MNALRSAKKAPPSQCSVLADRPLRVVATGWRRSASRPKSGRALVAVFRRSPRRWRRRDGGEKTEEARMSFRTF